MLVYLALVVNVVLLTGFVFVDKHTTHHWTWPAIAWMALSWAGLVDKLLGDFA